MHHSAVTLSLCLSFLIASAAPFSKPSLASVSPSLAWGTQSLFGPAGITQVSYETLPLSYAWNELLTSVLGRDSPPGLVVVFVAQELGTWELGQPGKSSLLQPLRSAVHKAPSSLALVNLIQERVTMAGIRDAVFDVVEGFGANLEVLGSCSSSGHSEDMVTAFKEVLEHRPAGKPSVVLACTSGSISKEMNQLQGLLTSLKGQTGDHACIFVSDNPPEDEVLVTWHGRSLLQNDTDTDFCDHLCQTQVKFVEGAILVLLLAFAAVIGICCLGILDTPTQFEKRQDAE